MSDVFDCARIATPQIIETVMRAPWAVVVPASSNTHLYAVHSGECWLEVDGQDAPIQLQAGDMVTLVSGARHVWRNSPATPLRSAHTDFDPAAPLGNRESPTTRIFRVSGSRDSNPFVSVYPGVVVIPHTDTDTAPRLAPLITLLQQENASNRPGRDAAMTRLSELIVIELVRFALPQMTAHGQNWLAALNDPHIGKAITLLHSDMQQEWPLSQLASKVGLSRANFVERFTRLVGEPTHRYLRRLRMRHAAKLLESRELAIIEIAESVGYRSESAFNRVFAKEIGVTPGRYRTNAQQQRAPLAKADS